MIRAIAALLYRVAHRHHWTFVRRLPLGHISQRCSRCPATRKINPAP